MSVLNLSSGNIYGSFQFNGDVKRMRQKQRQCGRLHLPVNVFSSGRCQLTNWSPKPAWDVLLEQ